MLTRGTPWKKGHAWPLVLARFAPHGFLATTARFEMASKSQQPSGGDGALSSLNAGIERLGLAEEISSVTPVKAVFGSVGVLLAMIRVRSPQSATASS